MKLSISLVAVKKVVSNNPRTDFSEEQLEEVAKLILEAEGIINPIILSRTSLESYEVVDGHFEYYAAVKARELDPRKGEMISAFILEEDKEKALREQIKTLREYKTTPGIPLTFITSKESVASKDSDNIELEDRIEKLFVAEMGKIKKEIEQALQSEQNKSIEIFLQHTKQEYKEIKDSIQNLQQVLAEGFKLIIDAIKPPPIKLEKPNLITAKKEDISKALKKVNVRKKAIEATYKAIEYWRNKEALTWENLKKSTKDKAHKIPDFGESTYRSLEKVTEIID
ncbi:MAG: ParB N-terminal domain-containing protein [Chroococcus sp. CMT-3BRIN-NPC107]|jgi:hypothetical protein|nr:ParB N-terminal domain-containing protein [Chroococcus sp. CMT-3BRIN-NPC107]